MPRLRALIFATADVHDSQTWHRLQGCVEHCDQRGYRVEAVIISGRWRDAVRMLCTGRADVLVTTSDIPADRVPRMEIAETRPFRWTYPA